MLPVYIAIGVVVVIGLVFVGIYNGLVSKRQATNEAFAGIDVQLKLRRELIPNLVETVKGYAAHERQTLDEVISARNSVASSSTTEERLQNENVLTGTLRSLFAVSEAYPNLKADSSFLNLQGQLQQVETDLHEASRIWTKARLARKTRAASGQLTSAGSAAPSLAAADPSATCRCSRAWLPTGSPRRGCPW